MNQRGRSLRLGRLAWGLALYCAAAPTLCAALYIRAFAPRVGEGLSFGGLLLWQGTNYFSWVALLPLVVRTGRRGPGRDAWYAPLGGLGLACLPIIVAHGGLVAALERGAFGRTGGGFGDALLARLPLDLLSYWAVAGAVVAADFYAVFRERRAAAADLEQKLARAQLETLKARLQPHFLFNTLQAITVLIKKDPDVAVLMTTKLAALLRASLDRAGAQEVPLREELRLVDDYLGIMRVRFRDRLDIEMNVDPDALDCAVPDLLLQPLVENALRHGIEPKRGRARLCVRAHRHDGRLELGVEDDGVGLPAGGASDGLGLAITRERLAGLYGDAHEFSLGPAPGGGTAVSVVIPARLAGLGPKGRRA
jgi:two-component system, LytTR family, sensor kinase